jgi:hypothetical protein
MLETTVITAMHEAKTAAWHDLGDHSAEEGNGLLQTIEQQHHANFDLWHEEDKARDPEATDAEIAAIKHSIDKLNQRRNDLAEQVDLRLLEEFQPAFRASPTAPLHSETPGMMIDRLSILALKIFHTKEESERSSATEPHRQKNRERLTLLLEQKNDLAGALASLFEEMAAGRRRFKLYRQMKMYNDPELNPAVYQRVHPSESHDRTKG